MVIPGTGERPWAPRPRGGPVDPRLLGGFTCRHCHHPVTPAGPCDNHCPRCLWSAHVMFGRAPCGALMEPSGVFPAPGGGWNVVWHHCTGCGFETLAPVPLAGHGLTEAMWDTAAWDREPVTAPDKEEPCSP